MKGKPAEPHCTEKSRSGSRSPENESLSPRNTHAMSGICGARSPFRAFNHMKIPRFGELTFVKTSFISLVWLMILLSSPSFAQAPPEALEQNPTTQAPAANGEELPASPAEPAEADIPEEAPPYPSRNARDSQLLAQASANEAQWLDTPEGEILALFRPTESRVTKGTLLLLHAAETPPGWPAPLENLRRNLPQYGWQTLAITLPHPEGVIIPARALPAAPATETEESSENEENSQNEADDKSPTPKTNIDTEDASVAASRTSDTAELAAEAPVTPIAEEEPAPVVTREELIAQRIQAALLFIAQQDSNNIAVLVDNSSINDSLQALANQGYLPRLRSLILINIQPQEALNADQLTALFSNQELPVLDVFPGLDNDQQQLVRKRHRGHAMRNQLNDYQQFVVPPMQAIDIDNARSFWLERIRGFLERYTKE